MIQNVIYATSTCIVFVYKDFNFCPRQILSQPDALLIVFNGMNHTGMGYNWITFHARRSNIMIRSHFIFTFKCEKFLISFLKW